MQLRKFTQIISFIVLSIIFVLGLQIVMAQQIDRQVDLNILPEPQKINPKMESIISEMINAFNTEGIAASQQLAAQWSISLFDGDRMRVVVHLNDLNARNLIGAIPRVVIESTYETLMQALVPLSTLEQIAAMPQVQFIRLPYYPELTVGSVTTEGVDLTNADDFHDQNYKGSGIKIAVLDVGFKDYQDLIIQGELPSDPITYNVRSDGDFESTEHGAACAEIAYDMAPEAQLYLVAISTDVEFMNAVDWLISQNVDVISASIGWSIGPFDDTGSISQKVNQARDTGIAFVTSAGNSAQVHYMGNYADSDDDRWHEFAAGGDEILTVYDLSGDHISAGDSVIAYLSWNAWPATDQDYDLYLYGYNGSVWEEVYASETPQTGTQPPTEYIGVTITNPGPYIEFGLAIREYDASGNHKFHLFLGHNTNQMESDLIVSDSSVTDPGVADGAITVGAVAVDKYSVADYELEYYSSQGPTDDGRIKPDISAPTRVSTYSYGSGGFAGTSASCPHMAGGAALLMSQEPSLKGNPNQLKTALMSDHAQDVDIPGPDNKSGAGLLKLEVSPQPPPVISVVPDSLSESLEIGEISTQTLTITNSGASDLTFQIEIEAASTSASTKTISPESKRKLLTIVAELNRRAIAPPASAAQDNSHSPASPFKKAAFVRFNTLTTSNLNVAVLGAEDSDYNNDVVEKLLSTGQFASVTAIDVRSVTPTLSELQAYDAVLVYSDYAFQDPVTLGNNLSDYVDAGGGVITAVFAMASGLDHFIKGRFDTDNYWAIQSGSDFITGHQTLGTVHEPSHPIMANVSSFDGGSGSYRPQTGVVSGATRIADWSDGKPLVATRMVGGTPRADLGFYPPSSDVRGSDLWLSSTDGEWLMANALVWVAGGAISWLSAEPTEGTIAAGDSVDVDVTFDATGLDAGDYSANLLVHSNDPANPTVTVPVDLTVEEPPPPVISVNPDSLSEELETGERSEQPLTIANTGGSDLTFEIELTSETAMQAIRPPRPDKPLIIEPKGSDAASGTGVPVINGAGGPDAFGYTWIDSDEPGGPIFDYIDISSTGTPVSGLSDDDYEGPFPIGFSFNFYGVDYTQFYISSNGFIGFGPADDYSENDNTNIPNPDTPNNIICWLWDDLYPDGSVYYQTIGNDIIIQFVDYGEYSGSGKVNAEVILSLNGQIKFQYDSFLSGFDTQGCTVGIENANGSDGLQIALDTDYLHDDLAVLISRGPTWLRAEPMAGIVPPGDSMDVIVTFDAAGLDAGDYSANLSVHSNDPVNPTVTVPVDLTVTIPLVNLTYNQIDPSAFPEIVSFVTVTDPDGNPIEGLTEANFTVTEDGTDESPITVEPVEGTTGNITVTLTIDRSGSMDGQPIEDAKAAANIFVDLLDPLDRAAIVSFNEYVTVDQSLTTDKSLLHSAIDSLVADGYTAIYDAVIESVNEIAPETGQKAVILLSDGEDNSSIHTIDEAISAAKSQSLPVYTIGLGLSSGSPEEQALQRIANETGGFYYRAPTSSELEELYRKISESLQMQYKITYTTHNPLRDGTTRIVEICVEYDGDTDCEQKTYTVPIEALIRPVISDPIVTTSEFWIDIEVNGVPNLFGTSFKLTYETTYLNAVDAEAGDFLGADVVFFKDFDDENGQVGIAISRKAPAGGVDGSGVVARIQFQVEPGIPPETVVIFDLIDVRMNDPAGAPIPVNPVSLSIIINYYATVWPGDTDNDGDVDQADIHPVGQYYSLTGPARPDASFEWEAQTTAFWIPAEATYADADGNGNVDEGDVLPIGVNWGNTHEITTTSSVTTAISTSGAPSLKPVAKSVISTGEEFDVDIQIGDEITLASNVFGVSFVLEYSPADAIEVLSVDAGTFLGDDVLSITYPDASQTFLSSAQDTQTSSSALMFVFLTGQPAGRVPVGITRLGQEQGGVDGYGVVVRMRFKVQDTVSLGTKIDLSLAEVVVKNPDCEDILTDVRDKSIIAGVYGDVTLNGEVTAADASAILKHVVGIETIPDEYHVLADVSDNGSISALDAALVLQKTVELITNFPVEPAGPALNLTPTLATINIPNATAKVAERVVVPIIIENAQETLAGEFAMKYPFDDLKLITVSSDLTSKVAVMHEDREGVVKLAFASTEPLSKERIVFRLEFEVLPTMKLIETLPVVLTDANFNDFPVSGFYSAIAIIPDKNALLQNYTNPFNPDTWIPYLLAQPADVTIRIYTMTGQLVRKLDLGMKAAGIYLSKGRAGYWDGKNDAGEHVASGTYFYTIQTGKFIATRKMVVVK